MYQGPTSFFKIQQNNVLHEADRIPRPRNVFSRTPRLCYKLVVLRKLPSKNTTSCNDIPLSGYYSPTYEGLKGHRARGTEHDIAFEKDVDDFSEFFRVDFRFSGGKQRDRLSPFEKPKPGGQFKYGALISDEEYTVALKVFDTTSPDYDVLACIELNRYFNVERTTVQDLDKEGDDVLQGTGRWSDEASAFVNGQKITLRVSSNFVERVFVNKGKLGKHKYNFFNEAKQTISLIAHIRSEPVGTPLIHSAADLGQPRIFEPLAETLWSEEDIVKRQLPSDMYNTDFTPVGMSSCPQEADYAMGGQYYSAAPAPKALSSHTFDEHGWAQNEYASSPTGSLCAASGPSEYDGSSDLESPIHSYGESSVDPMDYDTAWQDPHQLDTCATYENFVNFLAS